VFEENGMVEKGREAKIARDRRERDIENRTRGEERDWYVLKYQGATVGGGGIKTSGRLCV